MKILIIGSTGRSGKQLVQQSLEQNHETTALVRDPSKLSFFHKNLTVVEGNVLDKNVLLKALEGKDAVLSALGVGKSLKSNNLIENAVSILIPAMNARQVKRLIFLSAFGVGETFKQAAFIQKLAFRIFLRSIYADKAKGDEQIRDSGLDWTLVYPVLMTDNPGTGKYLVGVKLPMKGMPKITRADVATFMLSQLTDNRFIKKSAVIMG